jgi:uncharacterized protein YgbK (DUF1537 family)
LPSSAFFDPPLPDSERERIQCLMLVHGHLISAKQDPVTWNTNAGLLNLCHAGLERQIKDLERSLAHVSQQVAQVAHRVR